MNPIRVLITGGAGYLGSVICKQFLAAGYAVTVLDNLMYGQQSLFGDCSHENFDFVRGDARDEMLLRRLVGQSDIILPLAAIVGAPACDRDPLLAKTVNLEAIALVNRLRSPSQLVVFPMTNSGYGTRSGDVHCTEDTPLEPVSLYGRTKAQAETELLASPNTITLRLATVFGMSPRMRLDLLVNHFTYAAVTDGYLVIFEKDFRRNFVHIADVADGFLFCCANADRLAGRAYNLGLDTANLSKWELAQKIRRHVPRLVLQASDVGEDPDRRDYIVSNERLRQAGFAARRSLDDGIRELVKGFRMLPTGPFHNA